MVQPHDGPGAAVGGTADVAVSASGYLAGCRGNQKFWRIQQERSEAICRVFCMMQGK